MLSSALFGDYVKGLCECEARTKCQQPKTNNSGRKVPLSAPFCRWGNWGLNRVRSCRSHTTTEIESWAVLLSTGTSFWLAPVLSSKKGNFRKMGSWTTFLRDRGHGWWMYSGLRTKRPAWPWASSPRVTIFRLCYPGQVTFLLSLAPSGNNWASCWPHGAAVGSNEITNVKVLCKL